MVDEFTVDIKRMKESSCFDPENGVVVDERISSGTASIPTQEEVLGCFSKREEEESSKECRICQEECEESGMEAPCACNGTLKFAHRKCIQKWCNLKGNITCEICNQIFTPNYSSPRRRSINSDDLSIDIRQSWVAAAQHHRRFLAFTPDEFEDYSIEHNNNIAFCHSLILILMLLLLVRHIIVVARDSTVTEDNMKVFFNVSILQLGGIVLPCYVIIRWCYFHLRQHCIQRHVRHRQAWR